MHRLELMTEVVTVLKVSQKKWRYATVLASLGARAYRLWGSGAKPWRWSIFHRKSACFAYLFYLFGVIFKIVIIDARPIGLV